MRNKNIWIFNAGNNFDGNPKWLFMYLINHRPDITPYWFCYNKDSVEYIKKLGYKAYLFNSKEAKRIGAEAGVYVVNQRKEVYQPYFKGITILNLWHGVGCKSIEEQITTGFLQERIIKKNIRNMNVYRNNELFLVTSRLMEDHFINQCNLDESKLIRAGYPCCFSPDKLSTYDHDILKGRSVSTDAKIAIYAPTYRDSSASNFFSKAMPDMDRLVENLKSNNIVLIFKMHPLMSADFHYQNIKKQYQNCPNLIFWDNKNDVYEIFDKIDLAIIDYSSILYDLLARGVKHVIKYVFDINNPDNFRDFALDYNEHTCGIECDNFEGLLNALNTYETTDISHDVNNIQNMFWEYANESSMEDIINAAYDFEPTDNTLPILYSFDIFDTLLARTTFQPIGVFYYVRDKMKNSSVKFPAYLIDNYHKVRPWAESDVREYYNKSTLYRNSDKVEITFDLIMDRIKSVYQLTDEQIALLEEWELEAEYKTSVPIKKNIDKLKGFLDKGETVILISDMYLPRDFIVKLLEKADPVLATLPLFLSCEYGHMKASKQLFYEVYHKMNYNFSQWIHHGDNDKSDIKIPKELGIKTVKIPTKSLCHYETFLRDFISTYDGLQMSDMMSRFRLQPKRTLISRFSYCYASLYFVPYINWVIRHALEQGIECLYFISRDGHHLKRIADAIIEEKNYPIKAKYIYGSRKAWRIPSQIDSIDEEFWSAYGTFSNITSFEQLVKASALSEEEFGDIFPELMYLKEKGSIDGEMLEKLRDILRNSEKYRVRLLEIAKDMREPVEKYLKQEIDFNEKFAFVEFWARGYTQTCLANILWDIQGKQDDNIFYYARSIYPTHGNLIRYNFTCNTFSMIFIEAIFANLPYQSITKYQENEEGLMEPVIQESDYHKLVYDGLSVYLPRFARDYARMDFQDEDAIDHALFDFGLSYFHRHPNDPIWLQFIAPLKYSETMHGDPVLWAPPMKWKDIFNSMCGKKFATKNKGWSLQLSTKGIKRMHTMYIKHFKDKKLTGKIRKVLGKLLRR